MHTSARRRSISHEPLCEKRSDYMGQVFQCKAELAQIASFGADFLYILVSLTSPIPSHTIASCHERKFAKPFFLPPGSAPDSFPRQKPLRKKCFRWSTNR